LSLLAQPFYYFSFKVFLERFSKKNGLTYKKSQTKLLEEFKI